MLEKLEVEQFIGLGNEAVAKGLLDEGANYFSGYPGTPSTEIIEYVQKVSPPNVIAHWATNEAVALEDAAAAAISGMYAVFTSKHVGLNVAADAFVTLATMGINGGLVLCIVDDPSMHSSQNEQDTRWYGRLAHVPVVEPSDPSNAYHWARKTMELSLQTKLPVILRLTTRISHGLGIVEPTRPIARETIPYKKDPERFVTIPSRARKNKIRLEKALNQSKQLTDNVDSVREIGSNSKELGIIATGVAASYCEDLVLRYDFDLLIPHITNPIPKDMILSFIRNHSRILIVEELDGIMELEIKKLLFDEEIEITVYGKDIIPANYELDPRKIENSVRTLLGLEELENDFVELPVDSLLPRPPTFCAGCPHRSTFFNLKKALKRADVIYSNDIGCYSLGALPPFEEADSILCMGASIGMAVGYAKANPDKLVVSTIGDSTFWHSGISALVNAIWHDINLLVVVMDNSTTAMTGTQNNPSTHGKLNIQKTIQGMGIPAFEIEPFDEKEFISLVRSVIKLPGVKVIVAKYPCVIYENQLMKQENRQPKGVIAVSHEKCTLCGLCVEGLNCTALSLVDNKIQVDEVLCNGCEFCSIVCPRDAFYLKERA